MAGELRPWHDRARSAILVPMARTSGGHSASTALALAAALLGACGIPEPGIRAGAARLEGTVLCTPDGIGSIQNVAWLPGANGDGELWIGGENGFVLAGRDGGELERVRFARRVGNPRPIDVDGDGRWETMSCGEGWGAVGLLDADGEKVWIYPAERAASRAGDARALFGPPAPDAMAAGPVGYEDELAFIVGMNGSGGLCAFDGDGRRLWRRRATNVFSVAVADVDGDGSAEMLYSDAAGWGSTIKLRDAHGCRIRQLDVGFGHFSLLRWPRADSPPRVLGVDGDAVQIVDPCVDPEGRVLAEYELPDAGFAEAEGVLVNLAADTAPYLAVTRTIRATWQRSALYVFDADHRLVYHEVFPFSDIGAVAVPADGSGTGAEHLLVGAGTKVWRYALSPTRPSQPAVEAK